MDNNERFVNAKLLLQSLPAFVNFPEECDTQEKKELHLEKIINFMEETLILEKAEEIKRKRNMKSSFDELVEVAEGMKGSLKLSWSHYGGWRASCSDKRDTKSWNADEIYTNEYDAIDGFGSYESACAALLEVLENKEFDND